MAPLGRTGMPLVIAALVAVLAAAVVAGVAFGAVPIAPADVVGAIARAVRGAPPAGMTDALVMDLRLPRVLLAALVGMCLAGAGVLYQALFRNPLADPYILGVSSGAGLGATLALALAGAGALAYAAMPVAAFTGAVAAIALVVGVASRRGRVDMLSLLLAGVAVSYTLAALTSFVMVFRKQTMQQIVFWMMGGLQSASWGYVGVVVVMLAAGLAIPLVYARRLDVMLLGDERASQLGVDVERFKIVVLASASLLVAAAVAVSGLIGFVGLMTPHMARLVLGPDHRRLIPASVLAGGIVLVFADLASRVVLAPVELPVGIVTALLGGPFFVWLLLRAERVV